MKKAAGILFTDGKSILLLKRSPDSSEGGTWGVPGGGIKGHETTLQNAIRETKEETGLAKIPGEQIGTHQCRNRTVEFTTYIYRVEKIFPVRVSKEHTSYEWVPLKNLFSKKLHPEFKKHLSEVLTLIRRKIRDFHEWSNFTTILESLDLHCGYGQNTRQIHS